MTELVWTYYDRPVDELSRDELIDALKWAFEQLQEAQAKGVRDLRKLAS